MLRLSVSMHETHKKVNIAKNVGVGLRARPARFCGVCARGGMETAPPAS